MALDDLAITAKIKSQLMSEDFAAASKINVDTSNGVVTLSGNAQDMAFKNRAEQIARNTDGVQSVHNELNVAQGKTKQ